MATSVTRRVTTAGFVPGSPGSLGTSTWGRTWGLTWGGTWSSAQAATEDTPASPAVDVTARISGAPSANTTKRVTL